MSERAERRLSPDYGTAVSSQTETTGWVVFPPAAQDTAEGKEETRELLP